MGRRGEESVSCGERKGDCGCDCSCKIYRLNKGIVARQLTVPSTEGMREGYSEMEKPEASESSVTFPGAHLKRPSSTDGY